MTTKTNEIRLEIQSRLASLQLTNGKTADIQAVLNPIEARKKDNIPTTGRYAVLWTLDAEASNGNANAVIWIQPWGIDIPVEWTDTAESLLDEIKIQLASVLLPKINGVREQQLSALQISYPSGGSGRAVVSAEILTVYVESIPK